jgi:hypothetical protein
MKQIHIIGGGTSFHVRPHFAVSALAYGQVVRDLFNAITVVGFSDLVHLYTTKMAGNRHQIWTSRSGIDDDAPPNLETNNDIAALLAKLVEDERPKIIFLPAALCDFEAEYIRSEDPTGTVVPYVGKEFARLSSKHAIELKLKPSAKVIADVRKHRKDIFLVGFKATKGLAKQDQFNAGLELVKKASCNLVLANDLETRLNMVITPEQAPHHVTTQRQVALRGLVQMAIERSKGHFTRSEVVDGDPVPWDSDAVPPALRKVVDHCISRGAYKPFLGSTVGHFAYRLEDGRIVTSRRKTNFNNLSSVGMVVIEAQGDDRVIARGSKPSVGGQSQRIIFTDHPDVDCIVHFHCPLKPEHENIYVNGPIPVRAQAPYECGSHECGKNTSDGLKVFELYNGNLKYPVKAVMLDKHGPNIVFSKHADPHAVIDFIEKHWDLARATSEVP